MKSLLEISFSCYEVRPERRQRLHHVWALLRHETRTHVDHILAQSISSLVVRPLHRGRGPSVGVGTRMCPGVPTRVGVVQWPGPDNAGIERKSISLEGNPHSRRQAVSGLDLQ